MVCPKQQDVPHILSDYFNMMLRASLTKNILNKETWYEGAWCAGARLGRESKICLSILPTGTVPGLTQSPNCSWISFGCRPSFAQEGIL